MEEFFKRLNHLLRSHEGLVRSDVAKLVCGSEHDTNRYLKMIDECYEAKKELLDYVRGFAPRSEE